MICPLQLLLTDGLLAYKLGNPSTSKFKENKFGRKNEKTMVQNSNNRRMTYKVRLAKRTSTVLFVMGHIEQRIVPSMRR